MLTYNTYNTPNLDNLSPFKLALGRKPILVPRLENTPHVPVTGTFAKANQVLEQKLKYLRGKLQKFRDNRLALQNKDKEFHGYTVGQIVYMCCIESIIPTSKTFINRSDQFQQVLGFWWLLEPRY